MDAWKRWWNMAQGSLSSAQILLKQGEARSSASRAYYAAYQTATALLLYHGMTPPNGRETWSHDVTPELVRELPSVMMSESARKDIKQRLEACYELRIVADYISQANVEEAKLRLSLKDASFIVRVASDIFP